MRRIYFIILLSFFTAQLSFAQNSFTKDTKRFLSINGTHEYYEQVVDQLMEVLQQQYASQDVGDDVWKTLYAEKENAVNEIKTNMVEAYKAHFTSDDMKNMIAFYETETGKRLTKNRAALTAKDNENIAAFYKSATGEKIAESESSLNKVLLDVTEVWSSNLYKKMIEKLSEKGYYKPN